MLSSHEYRITIRVKIRIRIYTSYGSNKIQKQDHITYSGKNYLEKRVARTTRK